MRFDSRRLKYPEWHLLGVMTHQRLKQEEQKKPGNTYLEDLKRVAEARSNAIHMRAIKLIHMLDQDSFKNRLLNSQQIMREQGIDFAVITPGINFQYLTGQRAPALERLTALVLSQESHWIVVPQLESDQAKELHPQSEIISWQETENPYFILKALLNDAKLVALDEKMPYLHVSQIQKVIKSEYISFSSVTKKMRAIKDSYELSALKKVGESINTVHMNIPELQFSNKTEIELAKEIKQLILIDHETVDFVIVASGPNSANPHHQPGERVMKSGDVVVIDIGGTSKSGYCSDCTRTYVIDRPDPEFNRDFNILLLAQQLGVKSANSNVCGEELDQLVRDKLAKKDLAKWFIHRLGHGIGMETHEEPYLVKGNTELIEIGNVFSIEPGFYIPGKWGARIEDIVAITETGLLNFNDFEHDLRILN